MIKFGDTRLTERFWSKVDPHGPIPIRRPDLGPCWLWTRGTSDGYGHIKVGGRMVKSHRLAYEAAKGLILNGLDIDHLCRVRHCVNPTHLEAVTRRTNILRGMGRAAERARQTHCKRGHEFTPENTRLWRSSRICRTCRADEVRNRRLRQRAA